MVASVRHGGKSIGEIIETNIGKSGKRLFALFAWLTLVLVIAAFLNTTANAFISTPAAGTSSILFIILAMTFGYAIYRKNMNLTTTTILGVGVLFLCIYLGQVFPVTLSLKAWILLLICYIFVASILPVWLLLQPRDYLNSFLLYAMMIGAVVGIIIFNPTLEMVPYTGFNVGGQWLFPMLFVTVACGAISGFHSLVGSGTTSKQLNSEKDAKLVGYGSMLIEGALALVAIITAAYVTGPNLTELLKGGPINVFADGVGNFLTSLGISFTVGKQFAALALSAFALTTLDTASRLGRFIFQEFFSETGQDNNILTNRYFATLVTVSLGGFLAFYGWNLIWPMFGSANQLLAALALITIAVWLKNAGRNNKMLTIPTIFMFVVTLSALILLIKSNMATGNFLLVGFALALFVLAIILLVQAYKALTSKPNDNIKLNV